MIIVYSGYISDRFFVRICCALSAFFPYHSPLRLRRRGHLEAAISPEDSSLVYYIYRTYMLFHSMFFFIFIFGKKSNVTPYFHVVEVGSQVFVGVA